MTITETSPKQPNSKTFPFLNAKMFPYQNKLSKFNYIEVRSKIKNSIKTVGLIILETKF